MKAILLSFVFIMTLASPDAQAFWGERKLLKYIEQELDQKMQFGASLSKELNGPDHSPDDSWVLTNMRVLIYPMVGVGLGIINLKVKPLVEIRWARKANPGRLRPY